MRVTIDNKGFTLGDQRFIYDLYFLNDDSKVLGPALGGTFKKILLEWAEVLRTITSENGPFFSRTGQKMNGLIAYKPWFEVTK